MTKRITKRVWFGGGKKRAYFRYPARTSIGRCSAGKASLPNVGSKLAGTIGCILERLVERDPRFYHSNGRERCTAKQNG